MVSMPLLDMRWTSQSIELVELCWEFWSDNISEYANTIEQPEYACVVPKSQRQPDTPEKVRVVWGF